jgi:acyl carrier protein
MTDMLTDVETAKVQEILVEQLGVTREQLTPEARIEEDLGADSLDKVEITMRTEEMFAVTIPDEEAEKVKTVQDLYAAVGTLLGSRRMD